LGRFVSALKVCGTLDAALVLPDEPALGGVTRTLDDEPLAVVVLELDEEPLVEVVPELDEVPLVEVVPALDDAPLVEVVATALDEDPDPDVLTAAGVRAAP
jgi:hypothetical protein